MSDKASQYGTDANLAKRIAIYRYSTSPVRWNTWFLDQAGIPPGSTVLDVGCGNGMLWTAQQDTRSSTYELHLVDASAGMIAAAREALAGQPLQCQFSVASIEDLPFPAGQFDVVIANHMLYHVVELDQGLSEIARVLKADGVLLASTNGANHMRELQAWMRQAHMSTWRFMSRIADKFGLENGAEPLSRLFQDVQVHRYQERLEVPEVQPVLDYVASIFNADAAPTAEAMHTLGLLLQAELQSRGILRIELDSGFFECRRLKGESAAT